MLAIDWRIDAKGEEDAVLAFGDSRIALGPWLCESAIGKVTRLAVSLRSFSDHASDFNHLENALRLEGGAGLATTLLAVRIETPASVVDCPPTQ